MTAASPALPAPQPVVQRAVEPTLAKLLALLGQRATLIDRVTPTLLEAIADPAVKSLLAIAVERKKFVARDLVEVSPPEIRESVARAFLDEEFAAVADPIAVFTEIANRLTTPRGDVRKLEEERNAALARNDLARWRELNALIRRSTRMA